MNITRAVTTVRLCSNIYWITNSQQFRYFRQNYYRFLQEIKKRKDILPRELPVKRSELLEWNYDAELFAFGKRLQEEFDQHLLAQALTQKSFHDEQREEQRRVGIATDDSELSDNREMTYDGEEIMKNYIPSFLRSVLPQLPEEGIQSIKNHLMSEETLSRVSSCIGTVDIIRTREFPVEKSTLCNVLKALICALKESSGLERANLFVRDFIITQLAETDINDFWPIEDPISVIKMICHNENCSEPEPRIVGEAGVSTILALYRVGIYVDKQLIGLGAGETPKVAHEMAACDALRRLFKTSEHQLSIPFDLIIDPEENTLPNVSLHDWCEKKVLQRMSQAKNRIAAS